MNKPLAPRDRAGIEAMLGAGRRSAWHAIAPDARWLVVIGIVLGAAALMWTMSGEKARLVYKTEAASRGPLVVVVTATGSVQPTNKVDVSSELSGTVRKVLVDYNSVVTLGETLAELDTDKLKATVDSSRAKLAAAKAKVADAQATIIEKQRDLARKKLLAGKQITSTHDLDLAQAAYDRALAGHASAEADVGVSEADLKLSETNLAKATITSPINGVVLSRNVDPGQTVASSFQAPVLFSIAEDLKQMELQVDVDEADVGKVRVGQGATFSVDAFPDRRFPAAIRDVRFASETVQGVVTYKAVLSVDNSELLLRPGMTATAEIKVTEIHDALLVPNAALRFKPPAEDAGETSAGFLRRLMPGPPRFRPASTREETGRNRTIWVLRNGKPESADIVIGASDGRHTEIVSGALATDAAVIVSHAKPTS